MENSRIEGVTETGNVPWAKLGTILLEAIPSDKKGEIAYRVLAYIATRTFELGDDKTEPERIATKDIYLDLDANPNREPAAWMSPIWRNLEQRILPELTPRLQECCRVAGLNVFPSIAKAEGRHSVYYLTAALLPDDVAKSEDLVSESQLPADALHYEADLTLKLSRLGCWLFSEGMRWTDGKRWGFLSWNLAILLLAGFLMLATWLVTVTSVTPLNARDLLLLAILFVAPWATLRHLEQSFQLFDDRITLASELLLAWREAGATIEIIRSERDEIPNTILVRRYTATCPVCGSMVKLDKGEPDFPRRIVGRCIESPREHVFSFDRVTRSGAPLRQPPGNVSPRKGQ